MKKQLFLIYFTLITPSFLGTITGCSKDDPAINSSHQAESDQPITCDKTMSQWVIFSDADAKAPIICNQSDHTNIQCDDDATYDVSTCPAGFVCGSYNGVESCIQCPKDMTWNDGQCKKSQTCEDDDCSSEACPIGMIKCACSRQGDEISCHEATAEDREIHCINPKNNDFCGATSCEDLGTNCDGVAICIDSVCRCPNNSRYIQIGTGTKDNPTKCIDIFDRNSCGGDISNRCLDAQICNGTECVCPSGTIKLDDKCIDVSTDSENCGGYGNHCGNGKCINGICQCDDGYAKCDKDKPWMCIATTGSSANNYCGAKGTCNEKADTSDNWYGQQCPNYAPCNKESKCACSKPYIACNEECLDPKAITHCGITGCEKGQEGDDCTKYDADYNPNTTSLGDAFCDITTLKCQCKDDFVINPETNRCTDSMNDPNYCGFGNRYKKCNDGEVCVKGVCQSHCTETGTVNCNGYCINLEDNNMRLNSEGQCVCKVQGAKKLCPNLPSTIPGWVTAGCNTNAYVNDSSNNHCGDCFNSCEYGTICDTSGKCICPEDNKICTYDIGEYNHNEEPLEYCAPANDELHITGCKSCEEGWGNADGDWANGCEVNLKTNITNCGEVGNNCLKKLQNAIGISCEAGKCTYAACSSNYIDCNSSDDDSSAYADGCESFSISSNNCGSCLNECSTNTPVCELQHNVPRCCNANVVVKGDNILTREDCCDNLKLWVRKNTFSSNEYICASEKPDKSLTCSSGFLCVDWDEVE